MARTDPQPPRPSGLRLAPLGALALLVASAAAAPGAGHAQVAAGGLGTRVNGTALGRCSAGVCRVQGGTTAGRTLFHRFSQFDTRAGIQRVDLDSRGRANVVVGVSHPAGSFFDAPVRLSRAANLFWLSPGGLWLGPDAGFERATSLLLSTAPTLRIGNGEFSAVGGLGDRLEGVGDAATLDIEALARGGLAGDTLATGSGPIVLAGGRLTVDRHLLLHSGAGAIRSEPGAQRIHLQAGRSVQLSGGPIALQGLEVQAGGSTADDRVRIRAGLGAGVGNLELTDARLRGMGVQLEGAGGLTLRQVEARAGGPAGPGFVEILAGTKETAAAARLNTVGLEGGEVTIGARGPLEASRLRVAAGAQGGSGTLRLAAGAGPGETASLRLEAASLQGRNVVIDSQGQGRLENLRASPISLQAVEIRGDTVQVSAQGNLSADDLTIRGGLLSLAAEAPDPGGTREGSQAGRVQITSRGDLTATGLDADAETIQLQAGGLLRLSGGGELRASGGQGQVQLDALSPAGAPQQGRLELQETTIEAQTITGRADRLVSLQRVNLQAGQPGRRGLVRVETDPPAEPIEAEASPTPRRGSVAIEGSRFEGQWLLVRSGAIALSDSLLQAPKGIIQLEADRGDIQLSHSQLDVGVSHPLDLRREVVASTDPGKTLTINQEEPPVAIGLFAKGTIRLGESSALLANQNVTAIREANPGLAEDSIRLLDSSGTIVVDAGQALQIESSRIEADATDQLAGDIRLRSQSSESPGGISLRNAWISASGGAGSGDLRIASAGGIEIDNSHLLALASLRFEDPEQPGQVSPDLGFAGGEISLTNSSRVRGIAIHNAELNAEQSLTTKVLSGFRRIDSGRGSGYFSDTNDNNDNYYSFSGYSGGIISILSDAGIQISGAGSIINVGQNPPSSQRRETVGGIIRVGNSSPLHSVEIDGQARLSAISNPGGGLVPDAPKELRFDARGRIHVWSNGPIRLGDAAIDTSTFPQAGFLSPEDTQRETIALLSASSITLTNTSLRSIDPENISTQNLACPLGCSPEEWDPENHREFLSERFWGRYRPHDGLEFSTDSLTRDTGSDEIIERQKTQFSNQSKDWLVLADLPPEPILNRAESGLAAGLQTSLQGLNPAPLSAGTDRSLEWPDPGRWGGQALLAAPQTLAAPAALPVVPDGTLTASDLRPLSRADAEEAFSADQDKALRATLPFLARGSRSGTLWSADTLQEHLRRAMAQPLPSGTTRAQAGAYRPAILQISLSQQPGIKLAQINHILLAASGDVQGWQSQVDAAELQRKVQRFQQQLSGLGDLGDGRAGQELASVLLGPVLSALRNLGINALLLSLDRGLQGVPFAALPVGGETLADLAALTVTPALALTDLEAPPLPARTRVVLAGSSRFRNGLAPLPMARQELEQLASLLPAPVVLLDQDFSSRSLLKATEQESVSILHIASHAEFSTASRSAEAKIYTSDGEIALTTLAKSLSSQNNGVGLFVLNACRTAAGDELRELGITGLALQSGAHSALGNLWYVDDVSSTAFSLQFYRNLQQGLRRDQALQETQRQFRRGDIRVQGDAIVNAKGEVLVSQLNRSQQRQLDGSLSHPYYWSGILLSGSPW